MNMGDIRDVAMEVMEQVAGDCILVQLDCSATLK